MRSMPVIPIPTVPTSTNDSKAATVLEDECLLCIHTLWTQGLLLYTITPIEASLQTTKPIGCLVGTVDGGYLCDHV